jgi:hypothetical protein
MCVSCTTLSGPKKWTDYKKTPQQTYHEALGSTEVSEGMRIPAVDDINAPVKPVMIPPEVVPIWIYDHVPPDNSMVVGHWVFIILREPRWYIHDRTIPDVHRTPFSGVLLPERYEEGVK